MLEPRSDLATFKWRRTAFARIDGAVDIAEDDWSLRIDGMSAARIYCVRGGPHDRRWFWAVQIAPLVASRSTARRVMRAAAARRARLAKRSCGRWETLKPRSRPDWLAVTESGKAG
jgi:hypothetical protein